MCDVQGAARGRRRKGARRFILIERLSSLFLPANMGRTHLLPVFHPMKSEDSHDAALCVGRLLGTGLICQKIPFRLQKFDRVSQLHDFPTKKPFAYLDSRATITASQPTKRVSRFAPIITGFCPIASKDPR